MPINWDDLRFVLAVSRARSFQGAARRLRVTHTTVSRRIAAIEAEVKAPLFMRENNLCVSTPACARLVIAAGKIEEEVNAAERFADEVKDVPAGPVYISSVHWIINEVLLPSVPTLHAQCPGILLRFYGGLHDGPRDGSGRVLALRFELKPGLDQEVIPIGSFGYALYGPSDCANPEGLPWISFGGSIQYAWMESRGVRDTDVLITVGDATAVLAGVRSGVGKGLIPEYLGDRDPLLCRLSGPNPEFVRTLRVVGDWSEMSSARCLAVINWMETAFSAIGCGFSMPGSLPANKWPTSAASPTV